MIRTVEEELRIARTLLDNVLEDFEKHHDVGAIQDLINACESIDAYYREEFCRDIDAGFNQEEGSAYNNGVSIEFYIESDWWHDVSLALRRLREESKP